MTYAEETRALQELEGMGVVSVRTEPYQDGYTAHTIKFTNGLSLVLPFHEAGGEQEMYWKVDDPVDEGYTFDPAELQKHARHG